MPLDVEGQLADMTEDGREAALQSHRRSRYPVLLFGSVSLLGVILTLVWGELFYTLVFSVVFLGAMKGYTDWAQGPTAGDLAAGRLAEDTGPPEFRSWDEHVDEYGPDDPVMREALKTGEVDDPAFRKKHNLPPYDESDGQSEAS